MPADIAPGSMVNVTVTKRPTNEAAAKTLSRLFAKTPENRRLRGRRKDLRTNTQHSIRRGGRTWVCRLKAPRLVQPGKGDSCTIRATVDVIRDLGSVGNFVQIKSK